MKPWTQAAFLCGLALLPALPTAIFHPKKPAWTREALAPGEITLDTALALPDRVWLDARKAGDYVAGHIPGALPLNEDAWNNLLPAVALQFQPGQNLVIYCDSLECNTSHLVAERLRRELGAENVFILKGGWLTWQKNQP